jgi:uncharacterized metal-binding protein
MGCGTPDCCKAAQKMIFTCSGVADVGEIADRASRKLSKLGIGKMFCAVGIGGKVQSIINTTKEADELLAIDGCPLSCSKKSLELAGFENIKQIIVTDYGMKKGSTEVTEDKIDLIIDKAKSVLSGAECQSGCN